VPTIIPTAPGRHTIRWTITGPSGFTGVDCEVTYITLSIPYLKVYGNDVRVGLRDGQGSEEASDCPGWDDRRTAGIKAMWHDTGKKGAGAQLGIESLGEILSFASSAVRTPLVPYYLAFANTDPPRNGSFGAFDIGGDYGDIYCSKNFFSYHPSQAPRTDTSLAMNDVNINGHTTYIRPSTGTLTLTNGTTLSGGTVMYVEGNVVLSGDFKYSGSNSWATIDSIPYFYLVVKGNIYVDKGTTYMDGVYIAQPTTITSPGQGYTDGKIYTCTSGSSLFGGTNIHANCNSQLKVYGALIAQQIRFLRTLNTIGQSSSGQLAGAGGSAAPSEEIQFSPEIYLVPSPFDDGSGQSASTDQDITSLPPIF
jgi:hypothetical protein